MENQYQQINNSAGFSLPYRELLLNNKVVANSDSNAGYNQNSYSASQAQTTQKAESSAKILVVDDEQAMLAMAKAILRPSNYKVYTAEKGEEGVEIYKEEYERGTPISIVVMDLTLPGGISGSDALKEILKINPKAKVIAASGYLEDNAAESCLKLGFSGTLPKPYTAEKLIHQIKWLSAKK